MKDKTGKAVPALACVALLLLGGCQSAEDKLFKPRLAKSHYDAASTHVAVLTVAPWNDMVDKLQPGFTLTGDGALARSLPVTQLLMSCSRRPTPRCEWRCPRPASRAPRPILWTRPAPPHPPRPAT